MARSHVSHDSPRHPSSRLRERLAPSSHLSVQNLRGERIRSKSSQRRKYRTFNVQDRSRFFYASGDESFSRVTGDWHSVDSYSCRLKATRSVELQSSRSSNSGHDQSQVGSIKNKRGARYSFGICRDGPEEDVKGGSWRFNLTSDFATYSFFQILETTTEGEKPGGPPRNLKAEPVSSTEFNVIWDPPDHDLWNGEILGYRVGYKEQR